MTATTLVKMIDVLHTKANVQIIGGGNVGVEHTTTKINPGVKSVVSLATRRFHTAGKHKQTQDARLVTHAHRQRTVRGFWRWWLA